MSSFKKLLPVIVFVVTLVISGISVFTSQEIAKRKNISPEKGFAISCKEGEGGECEKYQKDIENGSWKPEYIHDDAGNVIETRYWSDVEHPDASQRPQNDESPPQQPVCQPGAESCGACSVTACGQTGTQTCSNGCTTYNKSCSTSACSPTNTPVPPTTSTIPTPTRIITPTVPVATFTPIPTPTVTPTVTPQPTSTPVPPTPTAEQNSLPTCTSLSSSPTSGPPSLTANLTCTGYDTKGYLVGFWFKFGDGQDKKIDGQVFKTSDSYSVTHTFTTPGNYWVSCQVRDNNGEWSSTPDSCKVQIQVTNAAGATTTPVPTMIAQAPSATPVPTATVVPGVSVSPTSIPVPKIPTAASPGPTILSIMGGIAVILLGIVLAL